MAKNKYGGIAKELPSSLKIAESYSSTWQKNFFRYQLLQLLCLVFVAFAGSLSLKYNDYDIFAILTIVALFIALYVRYLLSKNVPEKKWYNGRAAAESIKTLSWKYMVCSSSFPKGMNNREVDMLFIERINEIFKTVAVPNQTSEKDQDGQITSTMRSLRAETIEVRRNTYLSQRINNQIQWYSSKSSINSLNSRRLNTLVVILELITILLAVLKMLNIYHFDLIGIVTTFSAGILTWSQSKQYDLLSRSYSVTNQELRSVKSILENICQEREWQVRSEEAEEAISREHTLWKSSHSQT